MTSRSSLRIGTRGSPLALAQAALVRDALTLALPELAGPDAISIEVIQTTGDTIQDRRLSDIGGKGLFTKEIDEALMVGRVDLAVHSMKDVPTVLPEGIVIPSMLPRADPRDALIADGARSIAELPRGCVVGTSSLRRAAQLLARRPDIRVVPLRGNVGTRLRKVREGEIGATLLAAAGLRRLGYPVGEEDGAVGHPIDLEEMLPAPAQGAVGIACRGDDTYAKMAISLVCDGLTTTCVTAERSMLAELDGSCRTPIAALVVEAGDGLELEGLVASDDGARVWRVRHRGRMHEAAELGKEAGNRLRALMSTS